MNQLAIETKDLRIDYGTFCAVKGLHLSIPSGALFGLVGPNGAGKTSTLSALAGLLQPTHGEILLAGKDILLHPIETRKGLSYMPDLAPVIPDLKVCEFLEFYARMHRLPGKEIATRVDEVLKMVRMHNDRNKLGKGLSRGMTQRVVLAKSLLHRPRILLLDEPASGMDPIARKDLWQILTQLCREGVTVLLSSHILSELAEHCTHLGFMHLGELRLQGPIGEVMQKVKSSGATLVIEVLRKQEQVLQFLVQNEGITQADLQDKLITCQFVGDDDKRAELLSILVKKFSGIAQFKVRGDGLESILIEMEEGEGKASRDQTVLMS